MSYIGLDEIIGQDNAISVLRRAILANKLAHAYLFVGPSGVGKRTTAKALHRSIICVNKVRVCNTCEACIRGRAVTDSIPDLIAFDSTPSGLTERVGELLERLCYGAKSSSSQTVVLENVDTWHNSAINRLLKTLEEPIQSTYFVLTATSSSILATVKSRAQVIRFRPLSDEQVGVVLSASGIPAVAARTAILASGGSPGIAIAYHNGAMPSPAAFLAARTPGAIAAAIAGVKNREDALVLMAAARGECYSLFKQLGDNTEVAVHNTRVIAEAEDALRRYVPVPITLEIAGKKLKHAGPPPPPPATEILPAALRSALEAVFGTVRYGMPTK